MASGSKGIGAETAHGAPAAGVLPAAVVLGLILLSAFAVIHSSHSCRQLYARLQGLEASRWQLQEEYGRLLLEQSAWAAPHRVEQVAVGELDMAPPEVAELRVVRP